jgi:hypothetical protein
MRPPALSLRRLATIAATALALPLVGTGAGMVASDAHAAGSLTSYLGHLPNGTSVPAGPWSNLSYGSTAGGDFGVIVADGAGAGWTSTAQLTAPSGLSFGYVWANRAFSAPVMPAVYQPGFQTSFENVGWPYQWVGCYGHEWDHCYTTFSGDGNVAVNAPSSISLTAMCSTFGGSDPWPRCTAGAYWFARRMEVTLNDAHDPTATPAADTPLLSGTWQTDATQELEFTASDQGSGIYRAFWREGATTTYVSADPANSVCQDARPGVGSDYEFRATITTLAPCKTASQTYAPTFDLTELGDGVHTVTFGVEDATGREVILASDQEVRINAPGGSLNDPGTPCTNGTYDESGTCVTRPPSNTSLPQLTGTPAEGGTLSTDDGAWNDITGVTYTYAWELCDATGNDCTAIPGQTGQTLTLTGAMVDHTVRSVVTATTTEGTTSARSEASWPISRTSPSGAGGSGGGLRDVTAKTAVAGGGGGGRVTIDEASRQLPVPDPIYVTGPNGTGGDGTVRLDAWRAEARSGSAPRTIQGRLTTSTGAPIADAVIDIVEHVAVRGAKGRIVGQVTTNENGEFRYTPGPGVSRIFTFGYRLSLADTAYAKHTSVALPTAASVTLKANRSKLRNGQKVKLRGSVAEAPASSRKLVAIQVRVKRGWRTIATTRMRGGQFSYAHKFARTTRTTTYRFRARVDASSEWPLQTGVSAQRKVRVSPSTKRAGR